MTKIDEALVAFQAADKAWEAALIERFGDQAGAARYELRGRGQYGGSIDINLQQLFEDRTQVFYQWESLRSLAPPPAPKGGGQ